MFVYISWLFYTHMYVGPSLSSSYGSWIYNYLCKQYLSPLTLWVRIALRRGMLNVTLFDKVCQQLAAGRWFSPGSLVSSTKKITYCHDITEILLKVALNTINQPTTNVFPIFTSSIYWNQLISFHSGEILLKLVINTNKSIMNSLDLLERKLRSDFMWKNNLHSFYHCIVHLRIHGVSYKDWGVQLLTVPFHASKIQHML